MDSIDFAPRLKDLLRKLIEVENEQSAYEDVLRSCADEVESTPQLNMRLATLYPQEVATLVQVLEGADVSNMVTLDLSRNYLSSWVVDNLCKVLSSGRFRRLECLDLSYNPQCQLGFESSELLAAVLEDGKLPSLVALGLPACQIPTIASALLKGNVTKLNYLRLQSHKNPIQSTAELNIFFNEGGVSDLTILDLSDSLLTEDQLESLSEAIVSRRMINLEQLNLSYNHLGKKGGSVVGRAVRSGNLAKLKFLDLNWSHLGNEGLKPILEYMEKAPQLQYLNLKNNGIGEKVVEMLVRTSSRALLSLQEIRLGGKDMITNEGIVDLAKALRDGRLPQLLKLDLGAHKTLDFIGARALLDAYRKNANLFVLVGAEWPSESLRIQAEEQRIVNKRRRKVQQEFRNEEEVSQTAAKVFMCGYAKAGKTTLRKSLKRSSMESIIKWERRPKIHEIPRTRGIELSEIEGLTAGGQKINLLLWDLAGQQDFHVMHSAFLPGLGLAGGRATTFIVVFRLDGEMDSSTKSSLLLYWLRFIASGSIKGSKRHLVLVLNCIDPSTHGGLSAYDNVVMQWRGLLERFRERFADFIDIHLEPFAVDARRRSSVQELKQHILDHIGSALTDVRVPKICETIQEYLREWKSTAEKSNFPVMTWSVFFTKMKSRIPGLTDSRLDAAAAHLQESGSIIYYRSQSPVHGDSLGNGFIVADPEWFCKRVVGQLLLPDEMLEDRQTSLKSMIQGDGSLEVSQFADYFRGLLSSEIRVVDVIEILARLGLCYKMGEEKVLIPALLQRDDLEGFGWEVPTAGGWVMGRSLTPTSKGTTSIPPNVFHKLQVELAQDKRYGLPSDSNYCVGKSFSAFKYRSLMVLIQFDVDPEDPSDDRIDVLVKNLVPENDTEISNERSLELILQIMETIERLFIQSCPSVELDRKVIKPWSAMDRTPSMSSRDLLSVQDLKMRVQEHGFGQTTAWQVRNVAVKEVDLLASTELESIQYSVEQHLSSVEQDIVNFGLDIPSVSEESDAVSQTDDYLSPSGRMIFTSDFAERIVAVIRQEGQLTRDHMDKKLAELQHKFEKVFEKQETLLNKVLGLQRVSLQEKERSVPRYGYVSKREDSNVWFTMTQAFKESFRLHLLCEAGYEDGVPHRVEDQEGLDVQRQREWLRRSSPWLIWSFKVAIVLTKIGANFIIPGIGVGINSFQKGGDGSKLSEGLGMLATEGLSAMSRTAGENINFSSNSDGTTSMTLVAEAALKQLIQQVGPSVFFQKIALRRVVLFPKDPSRPDQAIVVWVCEKCFAMYAKIADRVRDITPFNGF